MGGALDKVLRLAAPSADDSAPAATPAAEKTVAQITAELKTLAVAPADETPMAANQRRFKIMILKRELASRAKSATGSPDTQS